MESLPLSWTSIQGITPVYRDIAIPFSRSRWITWADIPVDYSLPMLHDDLTTSFPDGFMFRGCTPAMGSFFTKANCTTLRTGAEAVIDLHGLHMGMKSVRGSLVRGKRHGTVTEILLDEPNRRRFDQFRQETKHAGKPQLQHLFRDDPSHSCRCFVFQAHSGGWLGAITLSKRGRREMHTELMLRHRHAPGDIMECLVSGIADILKNEGEMEWSLGEVPFLMNQGPEEEISPLERLMVSLVAELRHAYDYEGLYRFKNKFAPRWRPVMLCSSQEPTPLMLAGLSFAMGFTTLLLHQSLLLFRQWFIPPAETNNDLQASSGS